MNTLSTALRRLFHCHRWVQTPAVYYDEDLCIIAQPATRTCSDPACGKRQILDEHCLGLNPPAYVREWRTLS